MKKKYLNFYLSSLTLFFLFILSGCGNYASEPFTPAVSIEDLNNMMSLSSRNYIDNRFTYGDPINLRLANHSNEIIAIPVTETQYYLLQNGNWVTLENRYEYNIGDPDGIEKTRKALPTDLSYLYPKGMELEKYTSSGFIIIDGMPIIHDPDFPHKVRVLVIGTIVRDGELTEEQVAAYKDITVVP